MFKTIGNTFNLISASWRVLQEDRRLMLLPIMAGVAVLVVAAVAWAFFTALDRSID